MDIWKGGSLIKCVNVIITNTKENREYSGKLFLFNNFIVFTEHLQCANVHIYQGYSKNENVSFKTKTENGKTIEMFLATIATNFEITFTPVERNSYDWIKILRQTRIRRQISDDYI